MNQDTVKLNPDNEYEFLAYDKERDEMCACKLHPTDKDGVFFELEVESYKKYDYCTKGGVNE